MPQTKLDEDCCVIMIWNIKIKTKQKFKAWCAKHGLTMREGFEKLLKENLK